MESIRNIGILAHVDAGKTTLTEQLLLKTGAIRVAGRVDAGTAHTDALAIERQRGISIRANSVCVTWRGTSVRVIDTPGHVDFSTEVENALLALDGAILVVSAVEGVQAQTAAIGRVLRALRIPMLIFINKTDRAGADVPRVMGEIRQVIPEAMRLASDRDELLDALTRGDDILLACALDGTVTDAALREGMRRACAECRVAPALIGAALRGQGIEEVLDAIVDYLPPPAPADALSAVVYHVARKEEERQAHVRVFGGQLPFGYEHGGERITRMRALTPIGYENAKSLRAGDIGAISGLHELPVGGWLGEPARGRVKLMQPVLRAQVSPAREEDMKPLQIALARMADEWPDLAPRFEPRTRQMWVQVMGEIHRQVVEATIRETYGVDAALLPPAVLYRETPRGVGRGELDMYTSPWYARDVRGKAAAARERGEVRIARVHRRRVPEISARHRGHGVRGVGRGAVRLAGD